MSASVEAESLGDLGIPRRRPFQLLGQARKGEVCCERPIDAVANEADDVADLFLEHDSQVLRGDQIGRADVADEAGRADRGMASERQLAGGRKDPDPRRMNRVSRLEHEHGLGEIEFAGDSLHARVVEALAVQHHGERIARERRSVKTSSV